MFDAVLGLDDLTHDAQGLSRGSLTRVEGHLAAPQSAIPTSIPSACTSFFPFFDDFGVAKIGARAYTMVRRAPWRVASAFAAA